MFGALHVLREEPTYATALTETDGVAYTLVSQPILNPTCVHILPLVRFPPSLSLI